MAKYTYELLPLEQRHNFYTKKALVAICYMYTNMLHLEEIRKPHIERKFRKP
jgi:hypothetical protein